MCLENGKITHLPKKKFGGGLVIVWKPDWYFWVDSVNLSSGESAHDHQRQLDIQLFSADSSPLSLKQPTSYKSTNK